jgi:protein transport protein SEC20
LVDSSTATLRSTSTTHDTLTAVLGASKQLVTALEKSDWLDRVLILSAFVFFVLVVLFIVKQRVVDKGVRIAFWWTRFLPDFTGDEVLLAHGMEDLQKGTDVSEVVQSSASAVSVSDHHISDPSYRISGGLGFTTNALICSGDRWP